MALLVLVRHGESQWNLENRFTGWVDVPLTDTGRREAARAGRLLAGTRFDLAYSSVLRRANETLDIILRGSSQVDPGDEGPGAQRTPLRRAPGPQQGRDGREVRRRAGLHLAAQLRRAAARRRASRTPRRRRCRTTTAIIAPQLATGKNVLVVAHGNSLRSIVMQLDRLTREQVLELNIPTGVPIVYDVAPDLTIRAKRILGQ
ncbi:MAG: 2,3-bisphosphoglycerate-dependent phosphoglycerate mutase [Candidatus Binatia bacterium]